jgi:F-type H+-transporting ATPase subunit beta
VDDNAHGFEADLCARPVLVLSLGAQQQSHRPKDPERMRKNDANPDTAVPPDGIVQAVRGAVVDVVIFGTDLPQINSALVVEWDRPTPLILEVHSHLDLHTLRAVAFQSTEGLARGVAVRATGEPVAVPVGNAILGRLLDVVGDPQDNGPALPQDTPRRSIHALPPLLKSQTGTTDVFETGIKVIDLLTPMAQGGKAAMFGGAGVGKTVLVMELIRPSDTCHDCGRL